MSVWLLILGLVLFILLVVVHEFGHFIVAKRNGVAIEEFGLFFPPRLWHHKTKGGWDFSLNLIPLGGFVRLKGEHDSSTQPHSYGASPLKTKIKILVAGVGMNLLAAFVLLTLLALVGMPQLVDHQFTVNRDTHTMKNEVLIGYIEPDSPASKAGLHENDLLIALGKPGQALQSVVSAHMLPTLTKQFAGQTVVVEYARGGHRYQTDVAFRSQDVVAASNQSANPKGYLGISPAQYTLQRSTWSAPVVAGGLIGQFTALTLRGLGSAIGGLFEGNTTKAAAQVAGPVGIFVLLKNGSLLGYQFVLLIVAVISLSLAIMNILPIPALDGGKLFVTLIARALRKRLTEQVEALVYGLGFAFLVALIIVITIVDVRRYF